MTTFATTKSNLGFANFSFSGANSTNNFATAEEIAHQSSLTSNNAKVAAGEAHSLALKDGKVWGWGDNDFGQAVGGGSEKETADIPPAIFGVSSPMVVETSAGRLQLSDIIDISAGTGHSLALTEGGKVYGWGANSSGQVGSESLVEEPLISTYEDLSTSVRYPTLVLKKKDGDHLENIVAISASGNNSFALASDGTVWAWGDNMFGQIGNGKYYEDYGDDASIESYPVQVLKDKEGSTLQNIVAISAGTYHCLALSQDGTLFAWGYNAFGQIGNGKSGEADFETYPVQVVGVGGVDFLQNIVAISAGSGHNLALKDDGRVFAWGYNAFGQIGNGKSGEADFETSPVQVVGVGGVDFLQNIVAISAGLGHNLALKDDGKLYSWGYTGYGQLGLGIAEEKSFPPTLVKYFQKLDDQTFITPEPTIIAISASHDHSIAIASDGTLYTWGSNYNFESAYLSTNKSVLAALLNQTFNLSESPRAFVCSPNIAIVNTREASTFYTLRALCTPAEILNVEVVGGNSSLPSGIELQKKDDSWVLTSAANAPAFDVAKEIILDISYGSLTRAAPSHIYHKVSFINTTTNPAIYYFKQPAKNTEMTFGDENVKLTLEALTNNGAEVIYKWFKNFTGDTASGEELDSNTITSAKTASLDVSALNLAVSTAPYYFYCEITTALLTTPIKSDISAVKVSLSGGSGGSSGSSSGGVGHFDMFWFEVKNNILKGVSLDKIIDISAQAWEFLPNSVLEALKSSERSIAVNFPNGTLTLDGKKIKDVPLNKSLYSFEELAVLFKSSTVDPIKPVDPDPTKPVDPTDPANPTSSLSPIAIVGLIIIVVSLVGGIFFFLFFKKKMKTAKDDDESKK